MNDEFFPYIKQACLDGIYAVPRGRKLPVAISLGVKVRLEVVKL